MKISVLTPSFNSGKYLERSIQSVLLQGDPNFEHIIADGGSTDVTVDVLNKYSHLQWVSEPDNGQSDAMNKAFNRSTGDIIVYLNADDWFEPGVFVHVRELFNSHPEGEMVIGNLYLRYSDRLEVKLITPAKDYRRCLKYYRYRFPMNPVTYFYRREIQKRTGPFPIQMHFAMDYWFILRAMSMASVINSNLVFGTFFDTGCNKTSREGNPETPWEVATRHVREFDPTVRFYFYSQWMLHRYVKEFSERIKSPIRGVVYFLFFRSKLSRAEFSKIGFRSAWRRCYQSAELSNIL
jgi:glycosyltransferase involved in cell wall biosynthesis